MGLKLAVVGGGSTYTPELVDGFARRADRVAIDEIALLDIDPERLAIVGGLAERMLARQGWGGRVVQTTDRDAAIDGADFVLVQLRIGGQGARLGDETLPPRFGLIGQETVGVGGFAKALRTVPVVLELAEAVARRSAPGAWIVDFTNPVGIVTQALADAGHRSIGLCNVAIGFQRRFAARFGVEPERVELEQVGLNHLTWIRAVRVDGVDRLDELLGDGVAELADDVSITPERLVRERAIPSYYLRYYDDEAGVIADAKTHATRAEEVMTIEHDLLELYRDPTLDTKPELLEHRGGAFYSEAAAQLIASLTDGRGDIQVVDVRNDGTLPGLADADVVEVPARIDRDGAHPIPQTPLSPAQFDLVSRVKSYERLTIRAAMTGDATIARAALAANPLAGDPAKVDALFDAILEVNARWLPRFFPERMTAVPPAPTAMLREIEETPDVVARLLAEGGPEIERAAAAIRAADPAWVSLVARGTSDHAAIHLRYLIEIELGIPAGMAAPSTVTIYGADLRWRGGLVIAVSQSGRSPDLVAVVAAARAGGATTVAIVNDADSPLAAAAEHVIDCRAGEERSVAATKSYVAQVAAGICLVAALAPSSPLSAALPAVPRLLADSLAAARAAVNDAAPIVAEFAASERSIVIGRGFEYPTALETALKLKETSRLFAEGYSSADFSHGPVVLTGPEVPILAIRPDGRMGALVDEGIAAALATGSVPWVIGGVGVAAGVSDRIEAGRLIGLPLPADLPEALASLATILPGQLLAEAVARRRGYDPDAPPGLRKVTMTR